MKPSEKRLIVLAIVIGGIIASVLGGGVFDLWDTAIGISVFLILQLFPLDADITPMERRAYSCSLALASVMVIGFLIDGLFFYLNQEYSNYKLFLKSGSPFYIGALVLIVIWLLLSITVNQVLKKRIANKSVKPNA